MRAFLYFFCASLQALTGALHDGMSGMQIFIAIVGALGAGATALKAAISPNAPKKAATPETEPQL